MKKSMFFTVLIPLILLSLTGIVLGIRTVQIAPGQSKDITEEFEVWQGYYVLSFTLLGVEGDDAPYVTATLNSWHQSVFDREEMTAEVTLTLIDSAPIGAELSITLSYKYTFSSGNVKAYHPWIIRVIGGSPDANVTFNVVVPDRTPSNDVVYIAGDFNYWDPGPGQAGVDDQQHDLPMTNIGQAWEITVPVVPYKQYGYKFTRGYWTTVEKGPGGEEIANRPLMVTFDHTQMDTVANWADIPVSVRAEISNLPKSFMLSQNYPNPFNPSTTIKFDLPKTSELTLKIFNIFGEEVTTLVSDKLSAGSYSYDWNASNMASGVYLYRLEAEGFVETKKMILMR